MPDPDDAAIAATSARVAAMREWDRTRNALQDLIETVSLASPGCDELQRLEAASDNFAPAEERLAAAAALLSFAEREAARALGASVARELWYCARALRDAAEVIARTDPD